MWDTLGDCTTLRVYISENTVLVPTNLHHITNWYQYFEIKSLVETSQAYFDISIDMFFFFFFLVLSRSESNTEHNVFVKK